MAAKDRFLSLVPGGTDDVDLALREGVFLGAGGGVTVALAPATITFVAQPLGATPGVVTVGLAPAALTFAGQSFLFGINLAPATITFAAQPLGATPGEVTVALTAAALVFTARPVGAVPGVVTVALTPSSIIFAAQALGVSIVLTVALVDGGEILAPHFGYDQLLGVRLVDGGLALAPRSVVNAAAPRLEVTVTAAGSFTTLATLDESFGRSWLDQYNDVGTGTVKVDLEDPNMAQVTVGRWIRFWLDGRNVFTAAVATIDRQTIAQGEEHDQIAVIGGRGLGATVEPVPTYPSRGPGVAPIEDRRVFTWAAVDFDDSTWPLAAVIGFQGNPSPAWGGYPQGWPDPFTAFLWAAGGSAQWAAPGVCLFRGTFGVPAGVRRIAVFSASDDDLELYFEGQQVNESGFMAADFEHPGRVDLDVGEGTKLIAAKVINHVAGGTVTTPSDLTYTIVRGDTLWDIAERYLGSGALWRVIYNANAAAIDARAAAHGLPGGGHWIFPGDPITIPGAGTVTEAPLNPAMFMCCGWSLTADGLLDQLLFRTDATWKVLPYPPGSPGMTPGEILLLLISEAQARGDLADVTVDFTATVDSAGEPWPVTNDIVIPVGTTDLLGVLRQLADTYIDWKMGPGRRVLHAWNKDGRGSTTAVALPAGHFDELAHKETDAVTNAVLLRTAVGWMDFEQSASIAAHGRRESTVEVGWVQTSSEAWNVATRLFELFDEPSLEITGTFILDDDPNPLDPYDAWEVGDRITVPDANLDPTVERVLAISVREGDSEADEGELVVVPQLRSTILEAEEQWQRWLKRMAAGALAGTSWIPSPPDPARLSGPASQSAFPPLSFDGPLEVVTSLAWYAKTPGTITEVVFTLTEPGTTSTVVQFLHQGAVVATATLVAGAIRTSVQMLARVHSRESLQYRITIAGAGAEGLIVEPIVV